MVPLITTATVVSLTPTPTATSDQLLRRRASLTLDDPDRARLRPRIIEANLPLAGRLAHRYAGRGVPYEELAQVGALGLIKAVDGYDTNRGGPFLSYAI